jgi:amino acid transporter
MSKRAIQIVGIFLVGAIVLGIYGLAEDAFDGLQFSKAAKTWSGWAIGVVLLGLIYVLSESGFEWATEADRTTDPLGKRLARLFLGFVVAGGILLLAGVIYSLFT